MPDAVTSTAETPCNATEPKGSWCVPWAVHADARLPEALHQMLGEHFAAWCPPALPGGVPLAVLSPLEAGDAHSAAAAGDAAGAQQLPIGWEGMPVRVARTGEHSWCLQAGHSSCHLALRGDGPAQVRCGGPQAAALACVALTEVFRCAGWITLHAAGHATAQGRLRLSLGRSGAGKSWRALASARAGAAFVAEDRTWLREADQLLVPRDRRVRLLPDAAAHWLSPAQRAACVQDRDGKLRLPLELLGLRPAAPAPVAELEVLLGACPGDPLDLPPPERDTQRRLRVLQALWEAAGVPFTPPARAVTARAVQRLAVLPVTLWWRDADGALHPCAA